MLNLFKNKQKSFKSLTTSYTTEKISSILSNSERDEYNNILSDSRKKMDFNKSKFNSLNFFRSDP